MRGPSVLISHQSCPIQIDPIVSWIKISASTMHVSIVRRIHRSSTYPRTPPMLLRVPGTMSVRRCPRHQKPAQQAIIVIHATSSPPARSRTIAPFTSTPTLFSTMPSGPGPSWSSNPITSSIICSKPISTSSPMNSARSRTPLGVSIRIVIGSICRDPGCGPIIETAFIQDGQQDESSQDRTENCTYYDASIGAG